MKAPIYPMKSIMIKHISYRMKDEKMKWEFIKTIEHGLFKNREHFKRLKVPGGWLLKYMDVAGPKAPVRHAMVYIPDGEYVWDVTKESLKLEHFIHNKNPNFSERTSRFKVTGGWVVMDGHYSAGGQQSHVSLAFVPDPQHQWQTEQKENPVINDSHPFSRYKGRLSICTDTDTSRIKESDVHEIVTIGGIVTHIREMMTKSAGVMANVTIEDLKGSIEVIFFPHTYKNYYDLIHGNDPVIIQGLIEQVNKTTKMICEKVQVLVNGDKECGL